MTELRTSFRCWSLTQRLSRLSLVWLVCSAFAGVGNVAPGATEADAVPLSGTWRLALDPTDAGVGEAWFNRTLPERIQLPGILQSQGFGETISTATSWVLSLYDRNWFLREDYRAHTNAGNVRVPFLCQPPRHYLGAAWYQRDLEIPATWTNRRVVFYLERPRWETRVWLDDRPAGTNDSLCVPHEHELGIVTPGRHRLTVRVDNRMLMNYRPDAHAVSDSLGGSWNGIVGAIELRSTPLVWIDDVRVFPRMETKSAVIRGRLGNLTGRTVTNIVGVDLLDRSDARPRLPMTIISVVCPPGGASFETELTCGLPVVAWDEFSPRMYEATVTLGGLAKRQRRTVLFGFREFRAVGQDFVINGRPTHLRGTHHGGDFPLTGHPPCDATYWRKLFQTCKAWGLNHVRFHSFCPPEAAFTAADEIGIYLQPEPGMWNEISPDTPMERMLYVETERMIRAYGNHPSFCLFSASNEAKGRWKQSLAKWVEHFRKEDPRRLYTPDTGWSLIDEPGPVHGADYLAVHRIGLNMLRGDRAWFGRDYARSLRGVTVPVVSHELGQWCAYPDFHVIRKFTGYARPGNFEIFRDSAAAGGVLPFNREFARASGRFQLACYKEEIEANLRTPGLGGFQLLDLHDYTGQGTALVGLLDPFWEEKGYVKAGEWRRFCGPTVPLARLSKRVFTTAEEFDAPVEVAHFGAKPLTQAEATWEIADARGQTVTGGHWPKADIPIGKSFRLGNVALELSKLAAPAQYRLIVRLRGIGVTPGSIQAPALATHNTGNPQPAGPTAENDWPFWLYPAADGSGVSTQVLVTSSWREAETRLTSGGSVLFLPRNADLDWASPPLDNVPVFWNRLMNPQWGRMLGLWCDPNHRALASFPTEAHCDWQWTQLTKGARAVNVGRLPPKLKPIVAAIDDWNRNWKLAPVFECRVGRGKLLVCSFDLSRELVERPAARQLRRSLLDYAASSEFRPKVAVAPEQIRELWFDTLVMRKLGASSTPPGSNAVLDGDPNTFWSVGGPGRGGDGRSHPHALTIVFTNAVALNGVALMNRQNDRDHAGDIRSFTLEASADGHSWHGIASGELASTWRPQTVRFARTVTAQWLRLTALSGFGSDASVSLAELSVLYTGPQLPENSDEAVEYKRVRSTSSDVDEGGGSPAPTPRP